MSLCSQFIILSDINDPFLNISPEQSWKVILAVWRSQDKLWNSHSHCGRKGCTICLHFLLCNRWKPTNPRAPCLFSHTHTQMYKHHTIKVAQRERLDTSYLHTDGSRLKQQHIFSLFYFSHMKPLVVSPYNSPRKHRLSSAFFGTQSSGHWPELSMTHEVYLLKAVWQVG